MRRQRWGPVAGGAIVALAMVAGCGGGGGGGTTVPSASDTPVVSPSAQPSTAPSVQPSSTLPPSPSPVPSSAVPSWNGKFLNTTPGYTDSGGQFHNPIINGLDGQFTPAVGNTARGGQGPVGNTIDNALCEPQMSNNYHIHIFVGLYVNGTEYAIPRAIGIVVPPNPALLTIMTATQCFYYTHTHDSTGVVHVESLNNGVSMMPPTASLFVLKTVFDVWGITVNAQQFGQFSGPITVYTSGQVYRGAQNNGQVAESTLTRWMGDPNQIPLYSHEVIWFFVGTNAPVSLPGIAFDEEF